MTVHKINFYLGTLRLTPKHQRLFSYMDELTAMQQAFSKIVPHQLVRHCTLAAKLRQILPSLLLKFQAMGYEVTAIRLAVQADYRNIRKGDLPGKKMRIGRAGMERLCELAEGLPPSPLKSAVESLVEKQRMEGEKNGYGSDII